MRATFSTGTGSQRVSHLIADDEEDITVLEWPFGWEKQTQSTPTYDTEGVFQSDQKNRRYHFGLQVNRTFGSLSEMFQFVRALKNLPNTGRLEVTESSTKMTFPVAHLEALSVANGIGLTQVFVYRFSASELV